MKQGDILFVDFSPTKGHEQAGRRPALIVSGEEYNRLTDFVIVCPITNTDNGFPLHVRLDGRTKTTGVVLCEQIKTIDLNSRWHEFVETLPGDLLTKVLKIVRLEFKR